MKFSGTFPRAPKACKNATDAFFTCLEKHGQKTSDADTEAGARALDACQKQMGVYDACIARVELAKPKPFYRVQEEYRS